MADPQPSVLSEMKRAEKGIGFAGLAVIVTILIQTATIFIWGGKIDQRVSELEKRQATMSAVGETIARLDERTSSLVTTMDRIDKRLTDQEARR